MEDREQAMTAEETMHAVAEIVEAWNEDGREAQDALLAILAIIEKQWTDA